MPLGQKTDPLQLKTLLYGGGRGGDLRNQYSGKKTGNADNLKEELGDLLLQVVMHAQIAEEEGLFTMDEVVEGITQKMIRRHPHVFGEAAVSDSGEVLTQWADIKQQEKSGKEWMDQYLPEAFAESKKLIDRAAGRKAESGKKSGDN